MRDNQSSYKAAFLQANPPKNILPILPEVNKTQTIRYNEILTEPKNTDEEEDEDLYEAVSIKRGRPKKSRIRPAFENSIKRKCKVCQKLGYDNNHLIGLNIILNF